MAMFLYLSLATASVVRQQTQAELTVSDGAEIEVAAKGNDNRCFCDFSVGSVKSMLGHTMTLAAEIKRGYKPCSSERLIQGGEVIDERNFCGEDSCDGVTCVAKLTETNPRCATPAEMDGWKFYTGNYVVTPAGEEYHMCDQCEAPAGADTGFNLLDNILDAFGNSGCVAADSLAEVDSQVSQGEDAGEGYWFQQHCTNRGNECWQSTGLTHIRLAAMCGLSGGSGFEVKDGACPSEYGCRLGTPDELLRYTLGLGMSFWKKGKRGDLWARFSENGDCDPLEQVSADTVKTLEESQKKDADSKEGVKNRDNVPCCPDPMPDEPMLEQCRVCSPLKVTASKIEPGLPECDWSKGQPMEPCYEPDFSDPR